MFIAIKHLEIFQPTSLFIALEILSSKPAAKHQSAIKEFGFCSFKTTFKPIPGNGTGKIILKPLDEKLNAFLVRYQIKSRILDNLIFASPGRIFRKA